MTVSNKELVEVITEEIQKSDIWKTLKNDRDFEKRVKELASEVVTELFRVLWQYNAIFKYLAR